ncbi:ATP-grasp enzyme-like protein [Trichormus variabilis ATCC 29413]|uniref:ATP-grasp enzyme-like protein n=2 Tax=Anabaena variabilis TaxID=264691 RepID=Q3M6C5_TRIV2|nr:MULTISPECIES: ATP-grasp domain-containing protein [Nostocaceae]ABA23461.1 ATP-grasp enzyme-like protein [Trichormus variabilis ATCC 29413]MBC1214775.1 ATP-grasp domain-containing protein [Trichormus variabilis ARAD]MBC1256729.1 ATP-grasp domain-containing protein [Trichormus variabilis V5]MBC1267460.1 ATP-grasp domain-containing protein [Trichormus variabilis FSR]MBC1303587.1 ATP-grasp domain-containing protein [Trichormus variabilis N2B]
MAQSLPLSSAPATPSLPSQTKIAAIIQNICTLALLLLALPINATIVFISLLVFRPQKVKAANPQTILISGGKMTKALQLARSFHAAGHRVVLVETHKYWLTGHRFSQAVDKFYTVPAPQDNPQAYIQALVDIVKQENIDVYIPVTSPVGSYYDSLAKPELSHYCEVFHFDADITQMLDDKFALTQKARSLGLSVPKSFKITSPEQVINFDFSGETRKYILKSIPYDSVRRLDLTKLPCATPEETAAFVRSLPITPEKPWIMQEFIPGKEFCTHSTVRNGELRLHCCCESSAFQVNYENVNNPQITEWVQHFVKELKLTGQISFDFIQAEDGTVYAIECNPRTHSAITTFYDHPQVAEAYLSQAPTTETIQPLTTSKPTYWTYHEVWRLTGIRSFTQLQRWLGNIWRGTDAIYQPDDPLPFLMVHHWQIPLLLLNNLRRLKGWTRIDFNIGKLVELGGD